MWQWFQWRENCLLKARKIGEDGPGSRQISGAWSQGEMMNSVTITSVFTGWPSLVLRAQNCDCGPSSPWALQVSVNASFSRGVVSLSFLLWDCGGEAWAGQFSLRAEIIITLGPRHFSMLERLQCEFWPTFVLNKGYTYSLFTHYPCDYYPWIHHG